MWSAVALPVRRRLWVPVVLFAAVALELLAGMATARAHPSSVVEVPSAPVVEVDPPSVVAVDPPPAVDVDPLSGAEAAAAVSPTAAAPAAAAAPMTSVPGWSMLSGGYFGGANHAGASRFGTWRGTPVQIVGDYTAATWSDIANPWALTQWRGRGMKVDLAVWMFPSGTRVADVLAGRFDAYYRQLGQAVKSFGTANVTIRLGWEMNGDWFVWGAGRISSADYAAAWRRIVTLVRSQAPGAMFTWCPAAGKLTNAQVAAYYPGDAYVTFIGLDTYDNNGTWVNMRDGVVGLRWHRDFAALHGKPVAFPEWGLVDRGHWGKGDNPQYINDMVAWVRSVPNRAYQLYFEFDAPDGKHALQWGQFPLGAARYQVLY